MAKRTIYVREEDEALFDKLAEDGNLSAVIARAVKADRAASHTDTTEIVLPVGQQSVRFLGRTPPGLDQPGVRQLDYRDPDYLESVAVYTTGAGKLLEFSVDPPEKKVNIFELMFVDPLRLQVGRGLLKLCDPKQGAVLLERVTAIRRHIAIELGLVMPGVRFADNLQQKPNEYVIKVREVEVARSVIHLDLVLACGAPAKLSRLKGTRTQDPTYGMPAAWIQPEQSEEAERLGLRIFDPVSVVATQLTEVVRSHADLLLGLEESESLLANQRKTHPTLVAETVPGCLTPVQFWQVLQGLLRERVPIRDLPAILEALVKLPESERSVGQALEQARVALRRQICREYSNDEGILEVLTLDPELEEGLRAGDPQAISQAQQSLSRELEQLTQRGLWAVVLTDPSIRPQVRDLLRPGQPGFPAQSGPGNPDLPGYRGWPNSVILSRREIVPGTTVKVIQMVGAR